MKPFRNIIIIFTIICIAILVIVGFIMKNSIDTTPTVNTTVTDTRYNKMQANLKPLAIGYEDHDQQKIDKASLFLHSENINRFSVLILTDGDNETVKNIFSNQGDISIIRDPHVIHAYISVDMLKPLNDNPHVRSIMPEPRSVAA